MIPPVRPNRSWLSGLRGDDLRSELTRTRRASTSFVMRRGVSLRSLGLSFEGPRRDPVIARGRPNPRRCTLARATQPARKIAPRVP